MRIFDPGVLKIVLGIVVVSIGISYAVWSRIRVIFLKQDLFNVRDQLWDRARALNCFEDPAYLAARSHINKCISVSHLLSVQVLLAAKDHDDEASSPQICSTNESMQAAIEEAYQQCTELVYRYVLRHRLSGRLLYCLVGTGSFVASLVRSWVYSTAAESYLDSSVAGVKSFRQTHRVA